ncbi:hypothetical protein EG850_12195 [Gulosibacter macacae]|uniref:Uncharacterized protein n=1 Tax=Gulosibacter macacae TaxID=2488791 RepID=A0A3P3VVM2_9MICO|nr:hypothetical protein [Gulosibacter macacae]RRJ85676.1 hypothetical protein EG850_12195 [Gulosibacter macacae]
MTSTITTTRATGPDQTDKARQTIDLLLTLDPDAQQLTLARLVAATLHDGRGTALERFAATGKLDHAAVLDELDRVRVPFEQEAWVDALARHILFASGGRS